MYASEQGILNAQYNTEIIRQLPSTLFRPSLFIDGNQWCALYGANLQDGVAGFGDSPQEAIYEFDNAWQKKLSDKL